MVWNLFLTLLEKKCDGVSLCLQAGLVNDALCNCLGGEDLKKKSSRYVSCSSLYLRRLCIKESQLKKRNQFNFFWLASPIMSFYGFVSVECTSFLDMQIRASSSKCFKMVKEIVCNCVIKDVLQS